MHLTDRSPHSSVSPSVGEAFAGSSPLHSLPANARWLRNSATLARPRGRSSLPPIRSNASSTSTSSSSYSAASSSISQSSSASSMTTAVADAPRTMSITMTITPEEFDALPPAIQQKHFNSLERLRIAEEAADQKKRRHFSRPTRESWTSPRVSNDNTIRPRTSYAESLRPRTSQSFGATSSTISQTRRSLFLRPHADLTEDQALRFQALPAKVQRAHFSREELVLLTASSERVLGSQSPRYSRCVPSGTSVTSRSTADLNRGSKIEKDWADRELELVDDMADDNDNSSVDDFLPMHGCRVRKQSTSPSFESTPLQPPTNLDTRTPSVNGRPFSRRRLTSILAPLPLPPPRLMPILPPLPAQAIADNAHTRSKSTTIKHYTDSDARSQLRECVMSPEKFDEALEFGFAVASPAIQHSSHDFFETEQGVDGELDMLSLSDRAGDSSGDDRRDEEYDYDFHSGPSTPMAGEIACPPSILQHNTSIDSGVALPIYYPTGYKSSSRSLSPEFSTTREMTLKLSLTRHDLRMPEEKLYSIARAQASGVQLAEDPLRLVPLPVCEDHTGAKGAFAVKAKRADKKGLGRVWKTVLRH